MVQRKIFPASGGYSIAVASEEMAGGKWSAVATAIHSTETAQRTIDLPGVPGVLLHRVGTAAPPASDGPAVAVDQARRRIRRAGRSAAR